MSEYGEKLEGKLSELEEEFAKTQSNKATHKHLGILKSKIARIKKEVVEASKKQKGEGYFVKKSGDGTAALVGFPSAGKSSLINKLTDIKSKTAHYAFTTTTIIPAIMIYRDAHIQIFDLPGIIEEAHKGAGGGASVLSAIKAADLLVFVISADDARNNLEFILHELESFRIYVNKEMPKVQIKRMEKGGGIKIEVNRSGMDDNTVKEIFKAVGEYNAYIQIWDRLNEDELVAIISKRSRYINGIVALNKIDLNRDYKKLADEILKRYKLEVIPISATNATNIEGIKEAIYRNLGLIRIWLKPRLRSEKATPMTIRKGYTVGEVARLVHTEIMNELKCAYVKGKSVKFANQRVGAGHVVEDGDTVTFIT